MLSRCPTFSPTSGGVVPKIFGNPDFRLWTLNSLGSYFVPMARFYRGPIVSLRDAVTARRMLWLFCLACGHAHRTDPREVAFRLGAVTFGEMSPRLRCLRCGQKGRASILPCDREWTER